MARNVLSQRRGRGRPPGPLGRVFTVRLELPLAEAFLAYCDGRRPPSSMNAVFCQAVAEYLARQEKEAE